MNRRNLIKIVTASTISITGCVGDSAKDMGSSTITTQEKPRTSTRSVKTTDEQKTNRNAVFNQMDCPEFNDYDTTICYHTKSENQPLYISSSKEKIETNGQKIKFELQNNSDQGFSTGCNWGFKKEIQRGWKDLANIKEVPDLGIFVAPDSIHTWSFTVTQSSFTINDKCGKYSISHSDSGTYLFYQQGTWKSNKVMLVAMFNIL